MEQRFWIGVACRDHVRRGQAGGYAQFNHGKAGPARRPRRGDGLVYYSSKESFGGAEPCQRFTALGYVTDDAPVAVEQEPGFVPWRRQVAWAAAREAELKPLVPHLSFIRDKARWGAPFRFGFLEIPAEDFRRVAAAMEVRA